MDLQLPNYEITKLPDSPRPLLLGHRGASKYAPENTLAAFDLALQQGCDGFEFDVRYTRDARCVICHDAVFRRRRIDRWSFKELKLPGAEEVIRTYARRAYLDIELKITGDVRPLLDALRPVARNRFVLSSFLPELIESVHAQDKALPLALICEDSRQLKRWTTLPLRAVMIHRRLASEQLIQELHSAGKQVFVWTVNKESEMHRLAKLGVDGLISDDTQLLARTLKQT